jgi:hypothetical protein
VHGNKYLEGKLEVITEVEDVVDLKKGKDVWIRVRKE